MYNMESSEDELDFVNREKDWVEARNKYRDWAKEKYLKKLQKRFNGKYLQVQANVPEKEQSVQSSESEQTKRVKE